MHTIWLKTLTERRQTSRLLTKVSQEGELVRNENKSIMLATNYLIQDDHLQRCHYHRFNPMHNLQAALFTFPMILPRKFCEIIRAPLDGHYSRYLSV